MSIAVALKVSEGKRLIAKAVVASPEFRHAYENGRILIIKGTTNAYVVEEVTKRALDKLNFARGLTLPHSLPRRAVRGYCPGDILIEKGEVRENVGIADAVEMLGRGDMILKGANALNYKQKLAGVLIGDPRSGTIGMALRKAIGSHVRVMIPVGLEKQISEDIMDVVSILQSPDHEAEGMMPVWGTIFTEIEALKTLAGVEARHIASGGVAGAEGATWLAIDGSPQQLDQARQVLQEIYGEPNLD